MEKADEILTIEELAVYLQLHPLTVRSLARAGELPTFKVGRQWRVKRDILDHWLEEMSMKHLKEVAP